MDKKLRHFLKHQCPTNDTKSKLKKIPLSNKETQIKA